VKETVEEGGGGGKRTGNKHGSDATACAGASGHKLGADMPCSCVPVVPMRFSYKLMERKPWRSPTFKGQAARVSRHVDKDGLLRQGDGPRGARRHVVILR
jgi:hypothetical protein